jgi:hypothetical protein
MYNLRRSVSEFERSNVGAKEKVGGLIRAQTYQPLSACKSRSHEAITLTFGESNDISSLGIMLASSLLFRICPVGIEE